MSTLRVPSASRRTTSAQNAVGFEAPQVKVNDDIAESLFSDKDNSKAKNFKVVVRIRPPIAREVGESNCVFVESNKIITVNKPGDEGEGKIHTFVFDRVYDRDIPQKPLYESCAKPVVLDTLKGYNGSIIAYGQTGTGKTFTMEGTKGDQRGVIPRCSEQIFDYIENCSDAQSKFLVRVSFLQIYNERIADLLDTASIKRRDKKHLKIREDPSGGVYVDGLSEHIVKTPTEVMDLLTVGGANRTTAQTNMNRESSRSHAVFTIIVEHAERDEFGENTVTIGRLNLVDLAGSERIRSTGTTTGARLDETKNINKSLSAFGKVILALTSPGNHHVPYRDSKLTRILQGSLGGNCKTTMISAMTPASKSYEETVNTLKFAKRAKNVKNFAVVNQDLSDQALLSAYEKEIKRLRRELEATRDQRGQQQPSETTTDPVLLEELRRKQEELASEKDQIQSALQLHQEQVKKAEEEKASLMKRLESMEQQMLVGGAHISDHPEFHAAVQEVETKFKQEYDRRLEDLEKERLKLEQERAEFERQRALFERRSSVASESRLSMRQHSDSESRLSMRQHSDESVQQEPPDSARGTLRRTSSARRISGNGGAAWASAASEGSADPPVVAVEDHDYAQQQVQQAVVVEDVTDNDYEDDEYDGETQRALDTYVQALRDPLSGIPVHDRRHEFKIYRNCFSGQDAKEWFMANMQGVSDTDTAVSVGQKFIDLGVFEGIQGTATFDPSDTALFMFARMDSRPRSSLRRPSTSSTQRTVSTRPSTAFVEDGLQRSPSSLSSRSQPVGQQTMRARRATSTSAMTIRSDGSAGMVRRHSSASIDPSGLAPQTAGTSGSGSSGGSSDEQDMGATMLHTAAGKGDRAAMKTFLQTFPIDCRDNMGRTPLMYASINNKTKAVDFLLKQNADIFAEDANGRTSLLWASYYGHVEVVRLLVKQDPMLCQKLDPDGRTALHWATKHDNTRCLDLLLKTTPQQVIDQQDNERVTALHWAVLCQNVDATTHLLKARANPCIQDHEGRTVMHYAVVNKTNIRCLKVLLDYAGEIVNERDSRGRAPLHLAISSEGPLDIVASLLSCPHIDVNCTDVRMTTPLHWAAVYNRADVCQALIQKGAKIMFRDMNGMTALHYAIQKNHTACSNLLQQLAAKAKHHHAAAKPQRQQLAPQQYHQHGVAAVTVVADAADAQHNGHSANGATAGPHGGPPPMQRIAFAE